MPEADDLRGIRLSLLQGRAGRLKALGGAPKSKPDESMNSRVSWSVEGIDPSVRERAEAAARRAGMSLNDWLNSTIGDSAPPNFRSPSEPRPVIPSQETRDVADIHQRLDSITRQIEQISQPKPRSEINPRSETSPRSEINPRSEIDPRNDTPRSEPGLSGGEGR